MIVSHTLKKSGVEFLCSQNLRWLSYQIISVAIIATIFYMYSDDKERCFHDLLARMYSISRSLNQGMAVKYGT